MASKSSQKPYSLKEAREDVQRLLSSQGSIPFDEFAFVFRMQYGQDLRPEDFGCKNLQQVFERKMRDLVKIGGATHRQRFVTLQRVAATSTARTPARQTNRTSPGGTVAAAMMQTTTPRRLLQPTAAPGSNRQGPKQQDSQQPAYRKTFIVQQQAGSVPKLLPVCETPRNSARPRGPGRMNVQPARYPPPMFVVPGPQQMTAGRSDTSTGKRTDSQRLIKILEARAKDFARDCISDRKHVDSSRICQAILRERNVDSFKALGLRGHYEIPYIKELEQLQRRVYETTTAYCQVRATSTLYELGMYLAQLEQKENFEDLGLGPLLEQPAVYQYFKPRRTVRGVPEITTRDVLECLRNYMTKYNKWFGRIEMTDFMKFMARERGCADPFELCIRVPSLGLSISVLRKAQRDEKGEWRRIRNDIARETTSHIERKLRTAIENLLGGTERQLKPAERDRIEEIAGQPAGEVVQHVYMYLSHRDMFPSEVNDAMRRFFTYVSTNQFASNLFKLAICRGTLEDPDWVEDPQILENEEDAETEEEEDSEASDNENYDVEWDRKHHRQVVAESEVVGVICQWLEQNDDLDLRTLAQIEAKVALRFEAPEFTDLGHNSFLHLITHNPAILYIIEKSSLQAGLSLDSNDMSKQAKLKQVPREHVLDFLQQCGLGRIPVSLSQAICDQFGVARVEDLLLGSIDRLIQRGHTHKPTRAAVSDSSPSFPPITYQSALVCGSTQLESRVSRAATAVPGGSGLLGWQSPEKAVQCLLSCPLLGDLCKWSHWDEVFAPSLGPIKDFISVRASGISPSSNTGLFALETEPGVYLRITPECSHEAFLDATADGNSVTAAGQIVSLIIESGNVSALPLSYIANQTRTALERLAATADLTREGETDIRQQHYLIPDESITDFQRHPVVQFVLEMLFRIPYNVSVAVSQQLLLEPLHYIVGGTFASKLLLRYCTSDSEKTILQRLGIALGILEWVQDFERRGQQPVPGALSNKVMVGKPERNIDAQNAKEVATQSAALPAAETEESPNYDGATEAAQVELDEVTKREVVSSVSPLMQYAADENSGNELQDAIRAGDSDSAVELSVDDGDFMESSVDADDEEEESTGEVDVFVDSGQEISCRTVVDDILREEFGEGLELGPEEEKLVQKQRLREGRGLHRLSSELYSRDTHFVLELVQNADDNSYPDSCEEYEFQPAVVFVVTKNCVTVLNNECGFQEKHIRALCDVGRSTKGKHTKGYIGQKGIGFKSVFRITDIPEVHSQGYHIKFNAQSGPLGYILPHWIPPHERNLYVDELDGIEGADKERWTTKITLPLKHDLRGQVKTLAPRFHDVQPSLLLFLNRLKNITIVDKVNKTQRYMQRRDLPNGLVEVEHSLGIEKWLVVRREMDASKMKEAVGHTEVAIGFPLPAEDVLSLVSPFHQQLSQQKVFAYLPLQSYGLRFIVQADFEVPSSREAVDESSPWNQWLRSQLPSLFVEEGLERFKELPDMSSLAALCIFLRFVPLEAEVHGFFQPVTRQIVQLLKASKCMPVVTAETVPLSNSTYDEDEDDIKWVQPSQAVIVKDNLVYDVLPVSMLKEHLDLHYLHPKVAGVMNPSLARYLGVEELSTNHLLRLAETICTVHATPSLSDQSRLSLPWVAKWLVCLSRAMIREFNASGSLNESLKKLRIIPLSNGNFVSLEDKVVFFPLDDKLKKTRSSLGPSYLDVIHDDMHTVSRDLLAMQSNADNAAVYKLLEEMGVKKRSPREILHSHIFPTLESEEWRAKSPGLVASYLVFAKLQIDHDPRIFSFDKLRTCTVLLTNQGRLRPTEEIIHFGSLYQLDQKFDLQKLFPEMTWKVVDQTYLQLSDASNPAQIHSWGLFLQKLGVEVSLAIRERTVILTQDELSASHWGTLAKSWPQSPDGQYQICDCTCPEFLAVVHSVSSLDESTQKQRMRSLVELFDHQWDLTYSGTTKASVMNGSGEKICETDSSFYMELKRTAWIPAVNKYQHGTQTTQHVLCCPETLFLKDKKTLQLLDCHVRYADATVINSNFIKCLGFFTQEVVNEEFILGKLREWSGSVKEGSAASTNQFTTSLRHMWSLYNYLLGSSNVGDRQDRIRSFFQQERAFFVPNHVMVFGRKATDLIPGTFFTFPDVCWEDPTLVLSEILKSSNESIVPGPKLLCVVYACLGEHDCRSLGKLFIDKLDLRRTPSTTALLDVMEFVAGRESNPCGPVLRRIQKLYIAVSKKVREAAEKEAFATAKEKNPELPATLAKHKSNNPDVEVEELLLDEGVNLEVSQSREAQSVKTYIDGKVLFASLKNQWVSSDHRPMINDHPRMAPVVENLPRVHFLWVQLENEVLETTSAGEEQLGANQRQKRRLQSQRKEVEQVQIHEFFAICGLRKLSEVIREEVYYEGEQSCPQLQLQVRHLVPLIQRYIFQEIVDEYFGLIESGLPQRLEQLCFFSADRLLVSIGIEGLDVYTDTQEKDCALKNGEVLVVSTQAWRNVKKRHSLLGGELAKLFLPSNHKDYSILASFIDLVAEIICEKKPLPKFMKDRGLHEIPEDETAWSVPEPAICEEIPQQQVDIVRTVEETSEKHTEKSETKKPQGDELRSWPPRSSTESRANRPAHRRDDDELCKKKESEWSLPRRPEQWKGPDGQLPPKKENDPLTSRTRHFKSVQDTAFSQSNQTASLDINTSAASVDQRADSQSFAPTATGPQFQQVGPQMDMSLASPPPSAAVSAMPFEGMIHHPQFLDMAPPQLQHQFVPSAISSIKFEEVAKAAQLRPPLSVLLHPMSTEQEIGRYGEELVFMYLQKQQELGLLTHDRQLAENVTVQWVNQTAESGYPFDIQVNFYMPGQQTPKSLFIEVKTTTSPDKSLFEISNNELRFAHQQRDAFHLYRVFNAGSAAVRLLRLKNLSQYLDTNQVSLYLHI